MRSVEMIVEFPIEDANLPMPHLLGLANAAFVEEVERQGLLLMSPPSPSVMHARRIVEVRAAVVLMHRLALGAFCPKDAQAAGRSSRNV